MFGSQLYSLISLEEATQLQYGKYTSKPIIWGLYLCIFGLFKGQTLGFNLGKLYFALMPFPSILSGKYLIKPISGSM